MPSVLYITTAFEPAAVPTILCDLAAPLRERGWEAAVACLSAPPRDDAALQRAKEVGLSVRFLGLPAWELLRAAILVRGLWRRRRWDLAHSHLGRADLAAAVGVPRGVPLIGTLHSVRRNFHPLTLWGFRLLQSRFCLRTGVSAAVLDSFFGTGWLRGRRCVVYNPVDERRLSCSVTREEVRRGLGEGPVVVQVGRLIPVKAHDVTLAALALLRRRFPQACLVVAGDGPLLPRLQGLARQLGLEGVVHWWGNVEASRAYRAADVVVFPSRWEGLGLVPIEALLSGVPVVASDIPAVREFLRHGDNALLFPPDDPRACALALEQALSRPWDLVGAREELRRRFSPEVIAGQWADLYAGLLAGVHRRGGLD